MKKYSRDLAINLLLIMAIIGILWIGYGWLIGGPSRAYEAEDTRYVAEFVKDSEYDEAQMVSRFSFDTVYYIVEVRKDDVPSLAWFTRALDRSGEHELVTFEPVFELADTYGVAHDSIAFGVYEDKLVYVLRRPGVFEIFVSVDTLDIVLQIGGVF